MKRKKILQFLVRQLLLTARQGKGGFTLVELLVVAIVGSMIIGGLMTLVVQLMTTDRAESLRMETNREMQMALDYMSTELREAVYVYTGDCLTNSGRCATLGSTALGMPSTGILPTTIRGNSDVPVLVFWKQQRFPEGLRTACAATPANNPLRIGGEFVACTAGSSYSLVVYSLSTANPGGNTWEGGARIKRYAVEEYQAVGGAYQRTPGYISPAARNNTFVSWPYGATAIGGPTNAPVLVDYVDGVGGQAATCPAGYNITPNSAALGAASGVPDNLRSFYACVTEADEGTYQEVLVFLQGNIAGRGSGGVRPQDGRLSTLQTRVFTRGVLNAQ